MLPQLREALADAEDTATLIGPGHSSQIFPDWIRRGVELSLNNSDESCKYQCLADQVATRSEHGLYASTVPEDTFGNQTTIEVSEQAEHSGKLVEDGIVRHFRPTASFALSTAIMHGAKEVFVLGVDGCDPTGNGWRSYPNQDIDEIEARTRFEGINLQEIQVEKQRLELYSSKLAYFEASVRCAVEYHSVEVYNLSPFVEIDGAERLFDKTGALGKYNSSKEKADNMLDIS